MGQISDYEVIVMGGSAGGTDAIITILSGLPPTFRIPIIVVLHRQRNVESTLHEVIGKYLKLEVKEVNEKEKVQGGKVYLAPANYHVLIEDDGTFSLDVSENVSYSRPSIDVLFESAAMVYKEKVIGILVSGANSDVSEGLKAIADKKGMPIVQNPKEADSRIMPASALEKVKAFVMDKKQIQEFLLSL